MKKIIRMFAEFGIDYPLWYDSYTIECYDCYIEPGSLPISDNLNSSLLEWSEQFNKILNPNYPPDSKFPSIAEEEAFLNKGRELSKILQNELGLNYKIIYEQEKIEE